MIRTVRIALAESQQYGIVDLQALAFDAIQSRLSPKNIVQEVFSRFTSS